MSSVYSKITEESEDDVMEGNSEVVLTPAEIKKEQEEIPVNMVTEVFNEEGEDTLELKKEIEDNVMSGFALESSDKHDTNVNSSVIMIPIGIKEQQEDVYLKEKADPLHLNENNVKEKVHDSDVEGSALETVLYWHHVCLVCNQQFKNLDRLRKHLFIHNHYRKKLFKCDICKRAYLCRLTLEKHKEMHLVKDSFKCNICGELYVNEKDLITHKRTHKNVTKEGFKCNVCGELYRNEIDLFMHKWTHNSVFIRKRFMCDVCGKPYSNRTLFFIHKGTHDETATKGMLKCDVCEKSYFTKLALRSHKNTHVTAKQRVTCEICEKSYVSRRLLSEHKLKHEQGDEKTVEYESDDVCLEESSNFQLLIKDERNSFEEEPTTVISADTEILTIKSEIKQEC